jgi:hypothetical protein
MSLYTTLSGKKQRLVIEHIIFHRRESIFKVFSNMETERGNAGYMPG